MADVLSRLDQLEEKLLGIPNKVTTNIELDGAAQAEEQIASLDAAIVALPNSKDVNFTAEVDRAKAQIAELGLTLEIIPTEKAIKVIADVQKTETDITRVNLLLEKLGRQRPTPSVQLEIATAEARLLQLQAKLLALENKKTEIKVDDNGNFFKIGQAADDMSKKVSTGADTASKSINRMSVYAYAAAAAFPFIATAIVALPALLALVLTPVAAIAVGIDGIKAALASLKPEFDTVQAAVSAAFTVGLQPAIENIRALLPTLTTGLSGTAGSLSNIVTQATAFLNSGPGLQFIGTIFTNINNILNSLAGPIQTITANIVGLAASGSAGLSHLGEVIQAMADAWAKAISEMERTGSLQTAIDALIQVFGALGNLLPPLVEIGVELLAAFGPQLAAIFNVLATVLGYLATTVNFVNGLIGDMTGLFAGLSPQVQNVVGTILSFIPGLGLLSSGLQAAGAEAQNTAAAMTPTQAAIKAVSDAQANYNTIVGQFGPNSQQARDALANLTSTTQQLQPALNAVQVAQTALNTAIRDFGPTSQQAKDATDALKAAQENQTAAQKAATEATKALTDATKAQLTAMQSLVSSTLGYSASLLNVESAERNVAKAIKDHGTNSLEAKQAQVALSQAIDSAAQAASKQTAALTAGLSPLQQTQAQSNAYVQTLGDLASKASGPTKTALLGLISNMDASALAASTAAAEASGLATKVVTLPNGKTIKVIADATQIPTAMADVVKKAGDTTLAPQVKPFIGPVVPTLQDTVKTAQGTTLPPPVVLDTKGVGPGLTQLQQTAAQTPVAVPVTGNVLPITDAVNALRISLPAAPIVLTVTANTIEAKAQFDALLATVTALRTQTDLLNTALTGSNAQLTPMVTSVTNLNVQMVPLVKEFTDLNLQLTPMVTTLTNMNAQLLPLVTNFTNLNAQLVPLVTNLTNANTQFANFATSLTNAVANATTFVQQVTDQFNLLVTNIQAALDKITAAIDATGATWNTSFVNIVNAITNTVYDGFQNVATTVQGWMNSILDYLEQLYASFDAIGQNFGISMANGMLKQQAAVFNAGQALGRAATQGANSGIIAASPSKAGLDVGNNFGTSVETAILAKVSAVNAAGSALGKAAVAGATAQLDGFALPSTAAISASVQGADGAALGGKDSPTVNVNVDNTVNEQAFVGIIDSRIATYASELSRAHDSQGY
jgi:hypothetical protein